MFHSLAVQLGMAIIGAYMMRGPKYWEAEVIDLTNKRLEKRREVADKFRSKYGTAAQPLSELHGKQQRVARSPLMHRDSRLTMQSNSSQSVCRLVHIAMVRVVKSVILPAQFSIIR